MPPRKTAYVPDAQRHTERVTLRMAPDAHARLVALAARRGTTIAGAVVFLLADHESRAGRPSGTAGLTMPPEDSETAGASSPRRDRQAAASPKKTLRSTS